MVKHNFTAIAVVIDRSGSMAGRENDVIGGFNTFLKTQQQVPGKAIFTLAQFDDRYESIYDGVDIQEVKELTTKTYVPRGSTALLDAIGRTINSLGIKLNEMEEHEKPSKVIFTIITDGEENASQEFVYAKIKEMVEHQTQKYSWEFIFLGGATGMDAIAQGQALGVSASNSFNYSNTSKGTQATYDSLSRGITDSRLYGTPVSATIDPNDLIDDNSKSNN